MVLENLYELMVVEPGATGLKPIGPSCYINSLIQIYSNSRRFHNFYIFNEYFTIFTNNFGVRLNLAMQSTLTKLWSGMVYSIKPVELKRAIDNVSSTYHNRYHHDIQEFSINLNNWLDAELKALIGTSVIEDMFGGTMSTNFTCEGCDYTTTTKEKFWYLNLPISDEPCSLQECLVKYFEKQHIPDSQCSNCRKGSYHQTCEVKQNPVNMVITLKRFKYCVDVHGNYTPIKNEVAVQYGQAVVINNATYYLYGIISHTGNLDAGHYYTVAKNLRSGKWLKFDDAIVTEVNDEHLNETKEVYMLFFNREDEEKLVHEQFKYE